MSHPFHSQGEEVGGGGAGYVNLQAKWVHYYLYIWSYIYIERSQDRYYFILNNSTQKVIPTRYYFI